MLANPQGARQKAPGVTVMPPRCTSEGAVEGIESALSRRNLCTFTGLFLIHILKPRLSQKHSSCPQNHFALCLSTTGLSCCKFCFKNDEKMAKSEIK